MIPWPRYIMWAVCWLSPLLFLVLSPFEKKLLFGQVSLTPRFLEKYEEFNLYEYMGLYYGLNPAEDPNAISQIHSLEHFRWEYGVSVKDVKRCIDQRCSDIWETRFLHPSEQKVRAVISKISSSSQLTPSTGPEKILSVDSPIWHYRVPRNIQSGCVLIFFSLLSSLNFP